MFDPASVFLGFLNGLAFGLFVYLVMREVSLRH